MSSRLSRQEIKRDEVLETLSGALGFLRDHAKALLVGALALVVAGIGAVVWVQMREARAKRSSEALAEAVREFGEPGAEAEARGRLEELRDRYRGTAAAGVAAVYLADLAAAEGELERARELWQEFLSRQSGHALTAQVLVNRMTADRALGRSEQVLSELQAMVDREDAALPRPVVLHQMALTLERLGRTGEARDAYQRLAQEHPDSPYGAAAERQAEQLAAGTG